MSEVATPAAIAVVPADDDYHVYSNHWWETETTWWSWNVPDANMGGWMHMAVRANQETCQGGLWTWDDSPAGALYERRDELPFVRGDLRDEAFPQGLRVTMLEPLMKYRTVYVDPDGACAADLVHDAVMPPHSHPVETWPFWGSRHFDQTMHVTGTVTLGGETVAVDCYSVRDRSWGPRPSGPTPPDKRLPEGVKPTWTAAPEHRRRPFAVGYVFGTQDPDNAFLAFTDPVLDDHGVPHDDLTAGYLIRDGAYAPLVAGFRTITLDPDTQFIHHIRLEAGDALGRELVAEGELRAHHGERGPSGTGMFHWEWTGGYAGYGEDQSAAPPGVFEALDTG